MLHLMEQSAVAYRVRDKLIVGSIVRTAMGVGLEVDPILLEMTSPEEIVSAAIGQALARSDHVVLHPTQDQWKEIFKPFERAAGVRSYKSFMADANSVSLTMRNGKLELTPHRNLGSAEGFEPIPSHAIVLPAGDVAGAGVALKALLNASVQ
jgi:hypothetical protein